MMITNVPSALVTSEALKRLYYSLPSNHKITRIYTAFEGDIRVITTDGVREYRWDYWKLFHSEPTEPF